jgi:hypothetical protein
MMRFKALSILLLACGANFTQQAQAGNMRGVVEIFTSQGCSDCPSADRAFSEVITRGNILGLAWHVDYWDYLGWKDTFSNAQATSRQAAYGKGSYTPEVIVNGTTVVTNSRSPSAITSAMGSALPVTITTSNGKINIGAGSGNASIVLVKFIPSKAVAIQRGENAGKLVTYRHPVTGSRTIGSWNGKAMSIDMPAGCNGGCAVLLQAGVGRILGAATL